MKFSLLLLLLATVILSGSLCMKICAQSASAKPPTLRGIVVNRLSGEPIPLVSVHLTRTESPSSGATLLTDDTGHFQFDDLSEGNYSLTAIRSEYLPSQPFVINVGPDPVDSRIPLSRLGVISGTVFADDGDPLSHAVVVALRLITVQGKLSVSQIAQTPTDDLGSYRLHGLPAGRYYVKVNRHNRESSDPTEPASHAIFYPRATNQENANVIDVGESDILDGIDISIPAERIAAASDIQHLSEADSASIQGDVLNAASGDPLPNAKVALLDGEDSQAAILSTRSDASGHFSFNRVIPGTYHCVASRPGFLAHAAGSQSSDRSITVMAGQALSDIALRLIPQGVISGRVLEGSSPISNAIVMATRSSFSAGQRKLVLVSRTYTNDLGEYRLFDLPSGHYYVSVTYRDGSAPGSPQLINTSAVQGNLPKEDYVNTFYPKALTFADAVPLEITPGRTQSSIDLSLFRMHKWTVSGKVVLSRSIHFTDSPKAVLLPRDPSLITKFSQQNASVDVRTGAFTINSVPPGSYTLAVDAQAGDALYTGTQTVNITGANVDGIVVTLSHSFSDAGRVAAEGSDHCDLSGISASAQSSDEQGTAHNANALVYSNGSFKFENLRPGYYSLKLTGVTGNCYLKSVSIGAGDAMSTDVQLAQGAPPIEFVLSAKGGSIDGDVIDNLHQPVASAVVVLIPQPPLRNRTDLYKRVTTDQSGRFSLQGITPGDYKLFAWDAIDSESYLDPEMLAPFEGFGQSINFQAGSKSTIELVVIRNGGNGYQE